jgi:hypothetical protein
MWTCNATCPANQPTAGDMCAGPRNMACPYGAHSCLCVNGTWFCN